MNRSFSLALAATSLLAAWSAQALVIDGFNEHEMLLVANAPGSNLGIGEPVDDVIGGARKFNVTNVTGATASRTAAALIDEIDDLTPGGSNLLSVSNADRVDSTVTVIWDGTTNDPFLVNTTGLGGVNLLADNDTGFLFTIPTIDQNVELALTIWDLDNNNHTYLYQFPAPIDRFFIPFAEFTGIDFENVGAIRLVLNGPVAWDGSVDLFETGSPAPSPGTLLLLGAGLLALVRRGKRSGSHR